MLQSSYVQHGRELRRTKRGRSYYGGKILWKEEGMYKTWYGYMVQRLYLYFYQTFILYYACTVQIVCNSSTDGILHYELKNNKNIKKILHYSQTRIGNLKIHISLKNKVFSFLLLNIKIHEKYFSAKCVTVQKSIARKEKQHYRKARQFYFQI